MEFIPEPDDFDEAWAASLIGKHVLVGLTYLDHTEQVIEQKQVHGRVVRASASEGIVLALEPSQEHFAIPPALDLLLPAPAGEYRLRSTGEVVVDPDFTAVLTVTRPLRH